MSTPPGLIGPDTGPGAPGRPVVPGPPAVRVAAVGPVVGQRPPLIRPQDDRMLAGVAAGVAIHLGLPVRAVRFAFVVATLMGGPGAVLYAWLWALVPDESSAAAAVEQAMRQSNRTPYAGGPILGAQIGGRPFPVPPLTEPAPTQPETLTGPQTSVKQESPQGQTEDEGGSEEPQPPTSSIETEDPAGAATDAAQAARAAAVAAAVEQVEQEERSTRRTRLRADLFAGLCLLAATGVLIASWSGWEVQAGLVLPMLIVASGAVIAYAQFDEADRSRWFSPTGFTTRAATLRLLLGVVLVVLGIVLMVLQNTDPLILGQTLLATFAVLVGVAVVFAPWGVRFWRALDSERSGRVREAERADIAAHLHDSVLQTLALIQHRSADATEVARLARAQERDLRGWLYGGADNDPTMIAARVQALAAEAEDVHSAVVEVVTVGDRPVDERAIALLSALREAVANAARHAGGESVRVYVECMPDGIEAFVRDRGPGFDLAAVPEDRLGVRESIIGRMERHGGSARIRSEEGEGTEVRLLLPDNGSPEEEK
ncbi:PspC domain-containing protein [Kineosporia rhizophila]|uniref:ATP-binding protein n=1 Tax=Kineosporia rhizophila TaxID=84633 RepID=UPI001E29480D|nr:PspC domain-containing protein [Kineosporia rhizophila]